MRNRIEMQKRPGALEWMDYACYPAASYEKTMYAVRHREADRSIQQRQKAYRWPPNMVPGLLQGRGERALSQKPNAIQIARRDPSRQIAAHSYSTGRRNKTNKEMRRVSGGYPLRAGFSSLAGTWHAGIEDGQQGVYGIRQGNMQVRGLVRKLPQEGPCKKGSYHGKDAVQDNARRSQNLCVAVHEVVGV